MSHEQAGFTIVEILIALAVFSMIVIGAVGAIGAVESSGFSGFSTGAVGVRVARDYTAASVYLQSLQEFIANKTGTSATPGVYCIGSGCSPEVPLPSSLAGYPTPPTAAYQLNWTRLDVVVQRWHWDDTTDADGSGPDKGQTHCLIGSVGCSAVSTTAYVTRVVSTLTWVMRGVARTLMVERIIP